MRAQEQPAGETITNGIDRRKWTERGESVRGRKKIGSNWDRQASGVRAGSGNRWTSRHGIGSVRAPGRMDRLQLKLIGRALSLSSVLPVSHVNPVRPDQIRSAPMLLAACLISQSLPTTTLSSHDVVDNLIQTNGRRFTQVPTAVRPDWGRREGRGALTGATDRRSRYNQSIAGK